MPICSVCKTDLPVEAFSWKRKNVKRSTRCKPCQKIAKDLHYKKNREKYIQKAKKYTKEVVLPWVQKHKEENPCADCGGMFHYCQMDFDHIREKEFQISTAVKMRGRRQILEEIKKCDLVCSNCHRMRTFVRMMTAGLKDA